MARVGVTAVAVIGGLCGAGGLHLVQAQGSAPAYLVGETDITDPAAFREYAQKFPPTLVPHGAIIIAQGGKTDAKEGAPPAGRVIIIRYPSLKAAEDAWNDPAYQALMPLRQKSSTSRIFIVEGIAQ